MTAPGALTVAYDADCELCRRCRDWLARQPTFLPVRLVPADDPALPRLPRGELVVLADTGEAWAGPQAFLMCLWATREYRSWSYRLSGPAFAPLARRFFTSLSERRGTLSGLLFGPDCADGACSA